jgi:hypothetical protein
MATRQHGFFEEDVTQEVIADQSKIQDLFHGYVKRDDCPAIVAMNKARLRVITDILCECLDGSVNTDPTDSNLLP